MIAASKSHITSPITQPCFTSRITAWHHVLPVYASVGEVSAAPLVRAYDIKVNERARAKECVRKGALAVLRVGEDLVRAPAIGCFIMKRKPGPMSCEGCETTRDEMNWGG